MTCPRCGGYTVIPEVWLGVVPPRRCSCVAGVVACPLCGCTGAHFCTGGQRQGKGYTQGNTWGFADTTRRGLR